MKEITFQAPPTVKPELTEGVAVEILDRKLTRRGTTTLSKPVKLDLGRYIAQATLPDGQVLSTHFDVTEEGGTVAQLLPDQDASNASFENQAVAAGASPESLRAGVSAAQEAIKDVVPEARVRGIDIVTSTGAYRLLAGSELSGSLRPIQEEWQPIPAGQPLPVTGGDKPGTVQLRCGGRVLNMQIPLNPGEQGAVAWHWQDGRILPDVTFASQDVVTLLSHAVAGRIADAARSIGRDTPIARKQLRADPEHPICAVICAYILLRTNQIERMHGWTQELADRCDWLPDSLLVLAEYLARRGEHDDACRTLLRLTERGLPFFSSGLSYAVERLSSYRKIASSADRSKRQSRAMKEPIEWGDREETLLAQLRGIAARTDFDRVITTYEGQ